MGFGKRKRKGEAPRSRDDNDGKRVRADGDHKEGEARVDNGIWSVGNMCNPKFDAFYRAQGFLHDEDWNSFLTALRTPLPASFRLNPNYQFKDRLQKELYELGKSIAAAGDAEGAGALRPAVEPLEWFEGGSAFKLSADRRAIHRTAGLEELHKWMIEHTENGNITRQEAVSMVPPLALNVKPHHRCLDMCAAPGSKTTQILEVIAGGTDDTDENTIVAEKGMVVANDADANRAYMLVHQCRRMASTSLVITTHKGQEFPSIRPTGPAGLDRKGCFFDRVLCDVPCSGDGTLRKSPHIWPKWTTGSGVDLHQLQLIIAKRGYELTKPGGLMVYSTCSMSPYEDEAVVAELLRCYPDLELIDGRQFLPRFKCRPGLSTWHVLDDAKVNWKAGDGPDFRSKPSDDIVENNKMEVEEVTPATKTSLIDDAAISDELKVCIEAGFRYFRTPADIPLDRANLVRRFRRSLFPPTAAEAADMHLERCMRCVPQDEDTGGFFVATLQRKESPAKVSVPPAVADSSASTQADNTTTDSALVASSGFGKRAKYQKGNNEYQLWDAKSFEKIKEFYGLCGMSPNALYIRDDFSNQKGNGSNSKSIYYFPPVLREFMAGDMDDRLKCVSAGVKVLERKPKVNRGECEYRLLQDGVDVMARHMANSPRVITVSAQEFCNLLAGGLVSFTTLSAHTVDALAKLNPGSLICEYRYDTADCIGETADKTCDKNYIFRVVCFRGVSRTINVMCSKLDMDSIKRQLEALAVYRPKINAERLTADIASAIAPEENAEINNAAETQDEVS